MKHLTGVVDLHQHVLPGLDDGAKSMEESLEMLRSAAAQNIQYVCATPHACPGFEPFDKKRYEETLLNLQKAADERNLGITLLPGAEIAYTFQTVQALRNGSLPTLNHTDCVLIELWRDISWRQIREASQKLLRAGFTPVFAHVERYRAFLWQPEKAIRFKQQMPVLYQMNASMLLFKNGPVANRFLKKMLSSQAIDAIASDAHDSVYRKIRLDEAYQKLQALCPEDYVQKLFTFNGVLE